MISKKYITYDEKELIAEINSIRKNLSQMKPAVYIQDTFAND
jgi:hypothetical protein